MANGSIGDVPASIFAEYVPSSSEQPDHLSSGASDSSSDGESLGDDESNAPSDGLSQSARRAVSRCSVRPSLAHRLYSHRLHVRAKAKLQRDRLLSGPMLDVYVGEAKRHWALHRNLLFHHSELLESELSGDGKKKQDKLELPNQDPAGFELLVKWLYQGKLDDVSDMADPNQKYDYAVSCYKLYLLCDRLDMPQLKNVAMDQYRKGLNEAELVPDAEEIDEIYRKSPTGSPFKRLMTRIAARQIMDPDNDRDVETYRECFTNNADFAVDLVKAIKLGTGGMLFDDPTDPGNECEYHDHDAGPNCHIKGKGKVKQALKASALPRDPKSAKSAPSAKSDPPRPLPHLSHPPRTPRPQPPPQAPRQARRQDEVSSVGPLRRRITSPASSTVETSTEIAMAVPAPPSPNEQRDKFRRVSPPERRHESPASTEKESLQAPDVPLPSSEDGSHPPQDSPPREGSQSDQVEEKKPGQEQISPPRGIWQWAKAGTGRLGIIGRIPHPEFKNPIMTTRTATSAVNGALEGGKLSGSLDDFSVPSTTATEPDNEARQEENAAAKIEGLGISGSTDPVLFSQTKRSSDDLVASASVNGTPSPNALKTEHWNDDGDAEDGVVGKHDSPPHDSPPYTPSPPQRMKSNTNLENTPSPQRIPKYKIALAANILSPNRATSA